MSWKKNYPRFYRFFAKLRFALAREKIIQLPFGAKMRVNPYSYVERCIGEGSVDSLNENSVLWDIGANVGVFSLLAATRGAIVHSFEPEPLNLIRLKGNLKLNPEIASQVKVWPIALGNQVGQVKFSRPLSDNDGRSSFRLQDDCDLITVKIDKFDNLGLRFASKSFFKIDVEGAEKDVLEGMSSALEANVPTMFLVEVHREGGVDLSSMVEFFFQRGYRVTFFDDFEGVECACAPDSGDVALLARKNF